MSRTRSELRRGAAQEAATVRVGIYTRKSVSEGLEQQFNSLDAQREAIEAYVASQRGQGWVALPDAYDDGGYTGANIERPAFQRLLADVEAGRVDVVATYKLDRLSRSLLDFARLMEIFNAKGVAFVSVTETFDTTTPMGRMTVNLLATFAQFERETTAQRTRDKILASRRRGMWTGGRPVLGYDIHGGKLTVNDEEADRVRAIFDLYKDLGSLIPVVEELNRRGWTTKSWTTSKGKSVQGSPFNKSTLHSLLKNPVLTGRIRAGHEVVDGEHEAIVDLETFERVQHMLRAGSCGRARSSGVVRESKSGALLRGIARCRCGAALVPHAAKKDTRMYSYYVCSKAHKQGAASCPGSRVPVGQLEEFVVEQLRTIGRDRALVEATIAAEMEARGLRKPEVIADVRRLRAERTRLEAERKNVVDAVATGGAGRSLLLAKLSELDEQMADVATRLDATVRDLTALEAGALDATELSDALQDLDAIWAELFPRERARLLALLLETVEFDAQAGEVAITFRPGGPQAIRPRPAQGGRR